MIVLLGLPSSSSIAILSALNGGQGTLLEGTKGESVSGLVVS